MVKYQYWTLIEKVGEDFKKIRDYTLWRAS